MQLTNYEGQDLLSVNDLLKQHTEVNPDTVRELLKTCNVSFVLEGINRWQSTMICERKDSYVQQSQRYVTMTSDGYTLPAMDEEDNRKAEELIGKAFALYEEMSKLKGEFKGRPKAEHYLYGIPVEDARYILPLAVKTNLSVATTGDKLLEWFRMMKRPEDALLFDDIRKALMDALPQTLAEWLDNQEYRYEQEELLDTYYQRELDNITPEKPVILLRTFAQPELKAGLGSVTSTKAEPPSEVLAGWGADAAEKAKGVTKRVMSYGHTSVAEQCRTTFGMMFSLVKEMQEFQRYLAQNYEGGVWRCFLLNCQQVKIITSTNARMDCEMLQERICNNAQWEINRIAVSKLEELRKLSDILYQYAVPSCVYGACKEGKMTCGRAAEMREKYRLNDEL